jgi:hypothetical protein
MSEDEKNIPLGDDEAAVDVSIDEEAGKPAKATAPAEGTQKAAPVESDDDDSELENYSENVKKRIGRMTFKVRETERREKAAIEYAKGLQKTLEEEQRKARELDVALVREYENRLKAQEYIVRAKLREAIDRGDADVQIEANKELATIGMEQERVRVTKQRMGMDGNRQQAAERQAEQPQPQRPPQQVQAPQQPAQVDPKAQDWAARNKWFGADEAMTVTAFAHHKKLVEEEHFDPNSEDYYQELDRRIRRDFPHKFEKAPAEKQVQTVAGARPGNAAANGKVKIRLTPSQVAIAKKLNVPLEEYAKQLQKLNG